MIILTALCRVIDSDDVRNNISDSDMSNSDNFDDSNDVSDSKHEQQ